MGHTLGHGPERPQPVQSATADDEEVAISGGGHERRHRLVGQVFVTTIDDLGDEAFVDALAAVRHDRPDLGGVAIGEIPRHRNGLPRATFVMEEWRWICSSARRSASSAPLRCTSSSK